MSVTPSKSSTLPPTASRTQGAPFPYRGRVRTGCLTCRARKVKCDEQRPSCYKCTRAKRHCHWKVKGSSNAQHCLGSNQPPPLLESHTPYPFDGVTGNGPGVYTPPVSVH